MSKLRKILWIQFGWNFLYVILDDLYVSNFLLEKKERKKEKCLE